MFPVLIGYTDTANDCTSTERQDAPRWQIGKRIKHLIFSDLRY